MTTTFAFGHIDRERKWITVFTSGTFVFTNHWARFGCVCVCVSQICTDCTLKILTLKSKSIPHFIAQHPESLKNYVLYSENDFHFSTIFTTNQRSCCGRKTLSTVTYLSSANRINSIQSAEEKFIERWKTDIPTQCAANPQPSVAQNRAAHNERWENGCAYVLKTELIMQKLILLSCYVHANLFSVAFYTKIHNITLH